MLTAAQVHQINSLANGAISSGGPSAAGQVSDIARIIADSEYPNPVDAGKIAVHLQQVIGPAFFAAFLNKDTNRRNDAAHDLRLIIDSILWIAGFGPTRPIAERGKIQGTLPTVQNILRQPSRQGGPLHPNQRGPLVPTTRNQVNEMQDPVTGIEDPLSYEPRFNLWDDIRSGARWAWNNVGQPILTGQGQPQPGGQGGQAGTPHLGGGNLGAPQLPTDPSWWLQQGQGLRDALIGPPNGGNGNGNGNDFPLPFPIPQGMSLYGMLTGSGSNGNFNGLMMPGLVSPSAQARLKAPKGYVIVEIQPNDPLYPVAVDAGGVAQPGGSVKVAMMKEKARKCGYWKRRPKPALTSGDMKTLRKAERLKKKVAKTYLRAGIGPKDVAAAKKC